MKHIDDSLKLLEKIIEDSISAGQENIKSVSYLPDEILNEIIENNKKRHQKLISNVLRSLKKGYNVSIDDFDDFLKWMKDHNFPSTFDSSKWSDEQKILFQLTWWG